MQKITAAAAENKNLNKLHAELDREHSQNKSRTYAYTHASILSSFTHTHTQCERCTICGANSVEWISFWVSFRHLVCYGSFFILHSSFVLVLSFFPFYLNDMMTRKMECVYICVAFAFVVANDRGLGAEIRNDFLCDTMSTHWRKINTNQTKQSKVEQNKWRKQQPLCCFKDELCECVSVWYMWGWINACELRG